MVGRLLVPVLVGSLWTVSPSGATNRPSPPGARLAEPRCAHPGDVLIKEDPNVPGNYTMKVIGKNANIAGPVVGGGAITIIEMETGGVGQCFGGGLPCTSSASRDKCR